MKLLKNILFSIVAFVSWGVLELSELITQDIAGKLSRAIPYAILLCLSLWYLDWIFRKILLPLGSLPKEEREKLIRSVRSHLQPSFIYLAITGLGRLCCIIYILYIIVPPRFADMKDIHDFIFYGMLFLVLDTIGETRALIQVLVKRRRDNQDGSQHGCTTVSETELRTASER